MENILIISEDGKTIIGCDKSCCGEIVIPEGIISIAPEAFINSSISKIILPHSLISINYRAFKNCTCLEEAVLNEGIEFIGPQSFEGCTSLSIINLPHSINKIGRYCEGYVFSGCISLKSIIIPEGIKEINNKTFSGCSNLQTITLPSTLESIDYGAFEGCLSLQKVIISDLASWCTLYKSSTPLDYAHHLYSDDNTEIEHIDIPSIIDTIKERTFQNCTGIKSIVIPSGIKIKRDAFKGCVALKEITLYDKNVYFVLNELKECYNVEIINFKHFNPNLVIGLQGFERLKKIYSFEKIDDKIEIDATAILESKAQEMKLMSMFYYNMDMNLTMIYGKYPNIESFKEPVCIGETSFDELTTSKQEIMVLMEQEWYKASGMGLVLGWNDHRAIDFDYVDSEDIDLTISRCLNILGLPENYQWVVKSGSQKGFHIIIKVKDFGDKDAAPESFGYMVSENQRLELRWKGHLVLPPSIHNCGEVYSFYNHKMPSIKPQYVELGKIDQLLDYYCGEDDYKSYNWNNRNFLLIVRQKNNAQASNGVYHSPSIEKERDTIHWLETCNTPQAKVALAHKYLLGEDCTANKQKVFDLLLEADYYIAYFNLASLISVGYFSGTRQEVNYYLSKIDLTNLSGRNWFDDDGENHYESASTIIENIRRQAVKFLPESKSDCYLFFDTETTGIPTDYNAPSSDTSNWPRLVQLAWILSDENGNIIHTGNLIVKPIGFTIPIEASRIHGITTEKAIAEGISLEDAISKFKADFDKASFVVGHNVSFDKKIVGAEMIRLKMPDVMDSKCCYCTMLSSTNYCRIPGKYGYKYPKLQELYKKLFGKEFDNEHDAMSDIEATKDCFWELKKRNMI